MHHYKNWRKNCLKVTLMTAMCVLLSMPGAYAETSSTYLLDSGDVLNVQLPLLTQALALPEKAEESTLDDYQVVVNEQGQLNIPYMGIFEARGVSVETLQWQINKKLGHVIKSPNAFVTLKFKRPYPVYLNGEVSKPGIYYLMDPNYPLARQEFYKSAVLSTRFSDVIKAADGLLPEADIEKIVIQHENKSVAAVDLEDVLHASLKSDDNKDPILLPGDNIVIPRQATVIPKALPLDIAMSNLGPRTYPIRMLGLVGGGNTLGSGESSVRTIGLSANRMTLINALSSANINPDANVRRIQILRPDRNRSTEKTLYFSKVTVNGLKQDYALEPFDVIYIGHRTNLANLRILMSSFTTLLTSGYAVKIIAN